MTEPLSRRSLLTGAASVGGLIAMPAAAGKFGAHYEIEIRNFKYIPDSLTVRPGDKIRWTNRDRAPHDATGKSNGNGWNTKMIRPNRSADITVSTDMATEYICSIHPNMKASLTILAS